MRVVCAEGVPVAGVEVVAALDAERGAWVLERVEGGWAVRPAGRRGPRMEVVFAAGGLARRAAETWSVKEPLRGALGGERGWSVLDATGGLGRDAWMMAAWGYEVTSVERHPLLAWMLGEAAAAAGAPAWPRFVVGEATAQVGRWDLVYLDPMYPVGRKAALPGGELQVLQALVGHGGDEAGLLDWAIGVARRRVVVKRPRLGRPLEGARAPDWAVVGRSSRFDGYRGEGG
jgi:16S rRNA (guanine1516-N2)-methyltransferase